MVFEEFLWSEKYRPKKVSECILPEDIKTTFQEYVNKKEIPNLLLVSSLPGTGKTSCSRALCEEVGCDYLFLNGSSENGIDTFRNKITNYASSVSLTGGKKVIIIDEADYLTPNVFAALRSGIESFSKNCTFILTGNHKDKFPSPIQSRCAVINFNIKKENKKALITQFFKRVCNILEIENVEYEKEAVALFVNKWFPDNRRILNELQRYSTCGKIDSGLLSQAGEVQLSQLIKSLKTKDFTGVRQWVAENIDSGADVIFRKIYDSLYDILKPSSIPQIVLIVAKYQYQIAFVADPEPTMLAFFTEIMIDGEFA